VETKISYTEIEATKATSAINSKKKGNEQSTNKNLINPFHLPLCQIEPLRSKWLRQKQQNPDKE
jgi:hypothetical protein